MRYERYFIADGKYNWVGTLKQNPHPLAKVARRVGHLMVYEA